MGAVCLGWGALVVVCVSYGLCLVGERFLSVPFWSAGLSFVVCGLYAGLLLGLLFLPALLTRLLW